MLPLLNLLLPVSLAHAAPTRAPPPRPTTARWEEGRQRDVLVIKLVEDRGLRVEQGRVVEGPGDLASLNRLLAGAEPLFSRPAQALRAWQRSVDPGGALADLTLYLRIVAPDAEARGQALLADLRVETAYLAHAPAPPPFDPAPETPNLTGEQRYATPAPAGFGTPEARSWPGGDGAGVRIGNLEYDYNPDHEDLAGADISLGWGHDPELYPCHGTMVVGLLAAPSNGFGMTGLVPAAPVSIVSPYRAAGDYTLPDAVIGSTEVLGAGDVLLIEQQIVENGSYAPVEADPATFDAIALVVASGVVVVEPAANGGQDLDGEAWEGWFDRSVRDSGAILVGGGAPPEGPWPARAWTGGSCYGSRVDVQGWYADVATLGHSQDVDSYCPSPDLFFGDGDPNQAYTSGFGGTSAAAPLVTAVVAAAQGVALATRGEPWEPLALRAALRSTGVPQQGDEAIGPQPDLRALLRTWGVR